MSIQIPEKYKNNSFWRVFVHVKTPEFCSDFNSALRVAFGLILIPGMFLTLFWASLYWSLASAKPFGTKLADPRRMCVHPLVSPSLIGNLSVTFLLEKDKISLAAMLVCFTQPDPNLCWSNACSWARGGVGKQPKCHYSEALRHYEYQQPIQRIAGN